MPAAAGERRIVSVLVADLAGSTTIAEKLGPERYKFLLDEVVTLMREEVERFGGTVAQLTGDGVLALFGAPVAHEDDSERAVRAALAIRGALDAYGSEVGPAYGVEFGARVAVNTGPVVVPTGDAPAHVLFNALGDTVNVAARLQALGDLVIGPETARHVEPSFELDALGDIELKGKTEQVSAFRVVGVREAAVARPEPTLVGRAEELAALSEVLAGLSRGTGAIVSITGEPGIGKSRLVAEVEKRFDGRVRFLAGHAVAYAESIPYWPVREILRGWLGLGVADPEARVRLELRAGLAGALGGDADEAYPFLAELLGLTLEPDQEQRLGGFAHEAVQRQTFDWLYQLVCALARERPLGLVIDDLPWSDDATLTLLGELLPAAEQEAVCFVLIHRSDPDHPAWQLVDRARRRFRPLFSDLEPAPLTGEEARILVAESEGAEPAEELARLLRERSGGNPYFIAEALRDLRERGAIAREDGRLVLVGEATVPAAIQEALQARLDRLDGDARELLTAAAVIGRSFGLPLLERLLPRRRLQPTLSELQWLQLLVEERGGAAPEYRFRHGLVQEVAYGSILERDRRELHLRVGEALEELHHDSPAEVYGLLARHFAEADAVERAVDYLLRAGDSARAAYANDEAIEQYGRALAFMERGEGDSRARATLLKIGLTHLLAFDYAAAAAAFAEAFARPEPPPVRLEPTEHIRLATTSGWPYSELAPGHCTYSDLASWVAINLFRGLVAIGADLQIEPDLAERFTLSDDGCTYRFTLRPNACWSDGVPLTAHDVVFTLDQMADEGLPSGDWIARGSAQALDDHTLEIRLPEPQNHLLYLLGQPAFFPWPRHVRDRRGRDWYTELPVVGSGPFVLAGRDVPAVADVRQPGRISLAAAPHWYGPRGNVGRVTIELEPSPEAAAERWRAGEFDVIYEYLAKLAGIGVDQRTVAQGAPGGFTDYLGLDASLPPLDDTRIRLAVAHAIDRERLPPAPGARAALAGGLLPPAIPGHSHRVAPAFDPERARSLLRESGHPDGRDLDEITFAHFDIDDARASAVAVQLEEVGIRIRHRPAFSNDELTAATEEGVGVFMWSFGYFFPDPGGGFLEPLLREFPQLYRDRELEQLLAQARALRDQDERLRLLREFERLWIGEQAAVVPLVYNDTTLWRRPWVTGMWANAIAKSSFADAVVTRERPAAAGSATITLT